MFSWLETMLLIKYNLQLKFIIHRISTDNKCKLGE
jgi:hypothetical protein